MRALILKDLRILFISPLAYAALALFLFITGFAFSTQLSPLSPSQLPEASMRATLYFMAVILLFISPFLTMRSFAEEHKLKTMELLKTAPVSDAEMVLAKFIALWGFYSIMLLATLEFPLLLMIFGEPDGGPLVLAYLGLWLFGGACLALGLFTSTLVRLPMIAALITFVALLLLWFLGGIGGAIGEELSIIPHIESFALGVLDLGDVVYYLCFIGIFVFLAIRVLEAERWK